MIEAILGGFTVVGGIAAGWQIYLWVSESRGKFGWRKVTKAIRVLLALIQRSNFEPEIVVGLGRGGFIVAGLLSGNLGLIPLAGLDRKYIWTGNSRTVEIIDHGNISVEGKKLLLTIAEPYTGETLRKAHEYLLTKGAVEIRTASLFKSEICNFIPDFYAYEVKEVTKLPWRFTTKYPRDSKDPRDHVDFLKP